MTSEYEELCVHYSVCERREYCNGKECSDYAQTTLQGDLISRDILKEQIQKEIADVPPIEFNKEYHCGVKQGLKLAAAIIDNALTVNYPFYQEAYQTGFEEGKNERLKGEWIQKQETPASVSYYCSNCKMSDLPVLPYCPWCGAKMKGGTE